MESGALVISLAGHDAGRIYLVVSEDERFVYLSDGKEHKLARPKRKNIKHIFPVLEEYRVSPSEMTDGVLRKYLKKMGNIYDSIIN